ncbi:MAG: response regulator [Bacillati bacterium ANGP1]|uniref:Response regulator n=1 Tax=Candidatus Segetimicrobium genomatis TaxID=2569760 RepID=A0A537M2Y4_9BACT|nr:MAG: response regulator [Terrabacteria group bacterium ANGP1]
MIGSGPRVLVVDDDQSIRRFLEIALRARGYIVSQAADARAALQAALTFRPDLVILDLGLPDMDGVEVIRQVRDHTRLSILVLSARDQESEKIAALERGADDYLTKPFGIGELYARLRVLLRRMEGSRTGECFTTGALEVDLSRRLVTVSGNVVQLTPTEYDLLKTLVQASGRVLTHRQLLQQVWGPQYATEHHMLRVNISNLRRKLESDPERPAVILTEPRVGYRLRMGEPDPEGH